MSIRGLSSMDFDEAFPITNTKLQMKDFDKMRESLFHQIDDFRSVPKNELNALWQAGIAYRKSMMDLHEKGLKLVSDIKKLGLRDKNKWAQKFLSVGEAHETINQEAYECQCKLWDLWIMPLMNICQENREKEELNSFEKQLKAACGNLDSIAKKAIKERKKSRKKNQDTKSQTEKLQEIREKYHQLHKSFGTYKELRYAAWFKIFKTALEAHRVYFTTAGDVLNFETEKVNSDLEVVPFPKLDTVVPRPPSNGGPQKSSVPTARRRSLYNLLPKSLSRTSSSPRPSTYNLQTNTLAGYLAMKESKTGNSIKYWFVLQADSIMYYKSQHSAENNKPPLGTIPLNKRVSVSESSLKNTIEVQTPPTPVASIYYLTCASKEEAETWATAISSAVRLTSDSFVDLREQAKNVVYDSPRLYRNSPRGSESNSAERTDSQASFPESSFNQDDLQKDEDQMVTTEKHPEKPRIKDLPKPPEKKELPKTPDQLRAKQQAKTETKSQDKSSEGSIHEESTEIKETSNIEEKNIQENVQEERPHEEKAQEEKVEEENIQEESIQEVKDQIEKNSADETGENQVNKPEESRTQESQNTQNAYDYPMAPEKGRKKVKVKTNEKNDEVVLSLAEKEKLESQQKKELEEELISVLEAEVVREVKEKIGQIKLKPIPNPTVKADIESNTVKRILHSEDEKGEKNDILESSSIQPRKSSKPPIRFAETVQKIEIEEKNYSESESEAEKEKKEEKIPPTKKLDDFPQDEQEDLVSKPKENEENISQPKEEIKESDLSSKEKVIEPPKEQPKIIRKEEPTIVQEEQKEEKEEKEEPQSQPTRQSSSEEEYSTSESEDDWVELRTLEGEIFYYNDRTEETVWERPASMKSKKK